MNLIEGVCYTCRCPFTFKMLSSAQPGILLTCRFGGSGSGAQAFPTQMRLLVRML